MKGITRTLLAFKFINHTCHELALFTKLTRTPSSEDAISSTSKLNDSPETVLRNITEFCLKKIDFLDSSKDLLHDDGETASYSSWRLTCVILSLLDKLKVCIEAVELLQTDEEKSIHVLSIQSQIIVQKSVELVIGFGILPYLLPGVGVPEKLRKMNPSVRHFLSDARIASPYDQFLRLSHTLEIILICSSSPSLNALIVPKYACDLLAGLLQICKSPIARPKTEVVQHKPGALSAEQYDNVMMIRGTLQTVMTNTFLDIVPKATLINSLFLIGAAEKPRWISNACNELLCTMILSKHGLISVSTTMIESAGRSDTWKLMRIISNLMKNALDKSAKPTCHLNLSSLAEQCLVMVKQNEDTFSKHSESDTAHCGSATNSSKKNGSLSFRLKQGTNNNADLIRVGMFCGLMLMDLDFQLVKSLFWDKLFCHALKLDKCQGQEQAYMSGTGMGGNVECNSVSVSIGNFATSATYGELLLSVLKPMNVSLPLKLLQPVWSLFFQIFVACERYLKKPVQEPNVAAAAEQLHHKLRDVLILLFEIYGSGLGQNLSLSYSNSNSAASANSSVSKGNNFVQAKENVDLCDFCMMLLLNQDSEGIPTLNTFDLQLDSDDDDQTDVKIVRLRQELVSKTSDYNQVFEKHLDISCLCLSSDILKNERMKGIWPQLFRQLLAWGTNKHSYKTNLKNMSFKSDELPTRLDGDSVTVCLNDCQRFITFKLLGELGDEETILEQFTNTDSVEETLSFLELLLSKFTEEACANLEDAFDTSQLVMYALGIIGRREKSRSGTVLKTRFNQAMEDASSPMVPVKGHGILELRKLIEERNAEALENEARVLKVFQDNLPNEDSYVYLMSIQGMAALGLKFHKTVVPALIKEYDFANCDENSECYERSMYQSLSNEEKMETRMKVGEILVKVIQKLGDFAPSYRAPLTNVFFRLMRDEEPLIRASALSNLGELCHLLKFTLGQVLTEVWFCVESILRTEKNVHVRRAALHLLVLLLKGVEKDLTVEGILTDSVVSQHLRDVRRLLTHIEQTEVDLVAKTHCQLALQELQLIVKKLLTPSTSLNYKIRVLDL
ncbi:Transport and Golgi organization protein 6 [Orchesella cincta]|uniref:Transport and Golgi organization protein 6 n=1 Tax=Orchesella cincta TaxID=48709 RepID=A0A1D2MUG0_ORCCI|nr:Transport and Golgi organization protein 6 [Orchesella cincta]